MPFRVDRPRRLPMTPPRAATRPKGRDIHCAPAASRALTGTPLSSRTRHPRLPGSRACGALGVGIGQVPSGMRPRRSASAM
jgi:hypothetical protein